MTTGRAILRELAKERLKAAHDSYQKTVEHWAILARQHIIIPFCDKHQLRFCTGMGTYTFYAIREEDRSANDWVVVVDFDHDGDPVVPKDAPEGYDEVLDALLIDVPPDEFLHEYMEDYDPTEEIDEQ